MAIELRHSLVDWSRAPEFGRRQTLLNALQRLHRTCSDGARIIETGTSRDAFSREGDGWSTVAFGWYCSQTGGKTHTIDISSEAIDICRDLTRDYSNHIDYVCSDSLAFLRNWRKKERGAIDFIYLDSLDYEDNERSEKHNLAEAKAALHALAPKCFIHIDDTHPTGACNLSGIPPLTGKGTRTVPFLLSKGFDLEWCAGGQVLLSRGVRTEKPECPFGITAIVHTRNEARHIAECLDTLHGWTDEIIVCDMESTDDTVTIARQHGARIVLHPLIANFDQARNISAQDACFRWIFFIDADERVPPGIGQKLRDLLWLEGDNFEAVQVPFRTAFAGKWLDSMYPCYKAPNFLKKGKFHYNARPHQGVEVAGKTVRFECQSPEDALPHFSYDSIAHYVTKVNGYTDTEAANIHVDGQTFHWKHMIAHMVRDFQGYYDQGGFGRDGVHGLLYSVLSGFYRMQQHAKLYERRYHAGQLRPEECEVPRSVEEVLEFALSVVRGEGAQSGPKSRSFQDDGLAVVVGKQGIAIANEPDAAEVVWTGPLFDASGYGEESRNFVLALEHVGCKVAGQPIWSDNTELCAEELDLIARTIQRPARPGFIHIQQDFAPNFRRNSNASINIGRTMFETDRLPREWVKACNQMDFIWVPSEFNRKTFEQSGVAAEKLVVIPGCLDPEDYGSVEEPCIVEHYQIEKDRFTFVSVFDWTRHKGWDVLLRAFYEAFATEKHVQLIFKVWSSLGYSAEDIVRQADSFACESVGLRLASVGDIRFMTTKLAAREMRSLYRQCNAFVLPSQGEGWGRPYMEAMATGLPTIGTNWSGNTEFMNDKNSYLVDYELKPVPDYGWTEVPAYKGHRWAEPDLESLKRQMRRVFDRRKEANAIGKRARADIRNHYSREAVGKLMAAELERITVSRPLAKAS